MLHLQPNGLNLLSLLDLKKTNFRPESILFFFEFDRLELRLVESTVESNIKLLDLILFFVDNFLQLADLKLSHLRCRHVAALNVLNLQMVLVLNVIDLQIF